MSAGRCGPLPAAAAGAVVAASLGAGLAGRGVRLPIVAAVVCFGSGVVLLAMTVGYLETSALPASGLALAIAVDSHDRISTIGKACLCGLSVSYMIRVLVGEGLGHCAGMRCHPQVSYGSEIRSGGPIECTRPCRRRPQSSLQE